MIGKFCVFLNQHARGSRSKTWSKTIGGSTRKVRSIDRIADRETNVRGLDGLAHEHSGTESDCAM